MSNDEKQKKYFDEITGGENGDETKLKVAQFFGVQKKRNKIKEPRRRQRDNRQVRQKNCEFDLEDRNKNNLENVIGKNDDGKWKIFE